MLRLRVVLSISEPASRLRPDHGNGQFPPGMLDICKKEKDKMMSGGKKGLDAKHWSIGYGGLIFCLVCLLIVFNWISSSVPVLRIQESAVHLPTNLRLNEKEVTAILNAWPSAPQLLVYDFDSKNLDVHSVVYGDRFQFVET